MRFAALIIFCLVCTLQINAQVNVHGIYQGQHIIFSSSGINDSCKRIININNIQLLDTFGAIGYYDSTQLHLKYGDSISIHISSPCTNVHTYVLNTQPHYHYKTAIKPEVVFADTSGNLTWFHAAIHDSAYYAVQVFILNKWITVNKINAVSGKGLHKYETKIQLHPGDNHIRINYSQHGKTFVVTSNLVQIIKPEKIICRYMSQPNDTIFFEQVTNYEIYNETGKIIKSGTGNFVLISDLPRKTWYYINYNNNVKEFYLL
jgi:hypothetical protein